VACSELLGDADEYLLLEGCSSPNSFIQTRTYNKIGSTNYFKVVVKNADVGALSSIIENRGTSAGTILRYYDVVKGSNKINGLDKDD
jgi:hypothetical protein